MTKLEELIKELCPDGVKSKKIKDVYKCLKVLLLLLQK